MRIISIAKDYEDRLRADRERRQREVRLREQEERHVRLRLFETVFSEELGVLVEAGLSWTTEDQEVVIRQGRERNHIVIRCHADGSFNWKLLRRTGKSFRAVYYGLSRDREFFMSTVVRFFRIGEGTS